MRSAWLFSAALLVAGGCTTTPKAPPTLPPPPVADLAELSAILTTAAEGDAWWPVVEAAAQQHPDAELMHLSAADPDSLLAALAPADSGYALLVLPPDVIDVNFAWQLLSAASALDEDPFVDVRYGIITGATPDDAAAFLERIAAVRADPSLVSARLLDCLGPNQLDNDRALVHKRLFWGEWLSDDLECRGMNNGLRGFADADLDKLAGYGIYHFGGHGYPDRIDQGLTAAQLAQTELGTSLVLNGACSTGVTLRAFEMAAGGWGEREYAPEDSFCLTMLNQPVVAYLAATHPDHGVPVYQEMERLFTTGCTLGETIADTYNQVAVANGGAPLDFPVLTDGEALLPWGPTEIMLYGTASRVLYGDPTLQPLSPLHEPPIEVTVSKEGEALVATATVAHPQVAWSLMDTFHSDMAAQQGGFNDRVYVRAPLEGPIAIANVTAQASAGGKPVQSRVVGYAVEEWAGEHILHVQVDLESSGYQQGPIRRQGATVEVRIVPE